VHCSGRIRMGHQVERVTGVDTLELLFHCLTTEDEILSGWSRSTVGEDDAGRTTLSFACGWLSGASGGAGQRSQLIGKIIVTQSFFW
jgi:hypothetical protein